MAAIRQLAKQAMWYGLSSVGARMLNFLLTPLLAYLMNDDKGAQEYGGYSIIYAWIAILNIIFTYGFETGYFRFANKPEIDKKTLFSTTFGSLLFSSISLVLFLSFFYENINLALGFDNHAEYIIWVLLIIALDAISVVPFAQLRQNNRPRRYAFIKLLGIVLNIFLVLFFLVLMPKYADQYSDSIISQWWIAQNRIGLLIMSNLVQSIFVFLMLYTEWTRFSFKWDKKLWMRIFSYSSPMIIIGLAGMLNEVIDRQMLQMFYSGSAEEAKKEVGIYSMNYKLAIFITLFIQAFKLAAEPFFFKQAADKNAPIIYAQVMKWFVIVLCFAFLSTAMYLDVFQFIMGDTFRSGLLIVPIILMANVFLGIYYNLSVWYKITDKMNIGIYITLTGAFVTLLGNYLLIPYFGMYGSAWVTLFCYGIMVILAYIIGQKYYPIPYPIKKIINYLLSISVLFGIQLIIIFKTEHLNGIQQILIRCGSGTLWIFLFAAWVFKNEKKELRNLPVFKRILSK